MLQFNLSFGKIGICTGSWTFFELAQNLMLILQYIIMVLRPHQFTLLFFGIGSPFFREIKKKKKLPTRERKSADINLYLSVGWRDEKLKTE